MWKTVKNIAILSICLAGLYYMGSYLYNKVFWGSVETQSDIEIGANVDSNTTETVLYSDKYEYSIGYIKSFLGDNVELSDYIVVVDISEQTEYVYEKTGDFVGTYRISTGEDGTDREMSESLWRVVSKIDHEVAPLYGSRMMMMDRYVNGGWIETLVALHGTNEPEKIGTPFSLGCVYHNNADIIALFDILDIGTYVVTIE